MSRKKKYWLDKYAEIKHMFNWRMHFDSGISMGVVEYIAFMETLGKRKPKEIIEILKALPPPKDEALKFEFFGAEHAQTYNHKDRP